MQETTRITHICTSAQVFFVAEELMGKKTRNLLRDVQNIAWIVPNADSAEEVFCSLCAFFSQTEWKIRKFLPRDTLPFDVVSPQVDLMAERFFSLCSLIREQKVIVVTTVESLMQKLPTPGIVAAHAKIITRKDLCNRSELGDFLIKAGYVNREIVDESGTYSLRGLVLDFFSPSFEFPVRLQFHGNGISSIKFFDSGSQRTAGDLQEAWIVPVREFLCDCLEYSRKNLELRASEQGLPVSEAQFVFEALKKKEHWPGLEQLQPLVIERTASFFDYLGENSAVITSDELSIAGRADSFFETIEECHKRAVSQHRLVPKIHNAFFSPEEVLLDLQQRCSVYFDNLEIMRDRQRVFSAREMGFSSHQKLRGKLYEKRQSKSPFSPLKSAISKALRDKKTVLITAHSSQKLKRIIQLLRDMKLEGSMLEGRILDLIEKERWSRPSITFFESNLLSGFSWDGEHKIFMLSEGDIFSKTPSFKTRKRHLKAQKFMELSKRFSQGDAVVHNAHGIAIYKGFRNLNVENKVWDFIELEFADSDKLFIPIFELGSMQKYIGAEGKFPRLSKLGSKAWSAAKKKVEKEAVDLAGKLVNLYAKREVTKGVSFGEIEDSDRSFADSFIYDETDDQLRSIEDVLSDMASKKPMDRLVCGDVGYGKTEVAMRAAFRAAQKGLQTAVLVPTTVLAEQHYRSFLKRFADFDVHIGCLNRFMGRSANRETLSKLAKGTIDIIIGTHRLLSRDVEFKCLGLLIVDEEHRFGVAHKEKLKSFKSNVDVLTLTATPIPRTLHMSMMKIRDLSVIETAPIDRQVIKTYVAPRDEGLIREAVLRELERGGQVYFIHNRVKSIYRIAEELKELLPKAKLDIGHGQMKGSELEEVMRRFVYGESDILLCTTIVESGLDISNANTIIIDDADKLGLADLYQLRGRVGRSFRRAYAYLMVPDLRKLSRESRKRLEVLQSLDELGAGFRLALQDMEIRGAGNLLGKDQSGQINAVGFELYGRILKRAIANLGKNDIEEEDVIEPDVKMDFSAHIPPKWIPDAGERLLLYQRLVNLKSVNAGHELMEEMEDRFGTVPDEVADLVESMILRSKLKELKVIGLVLKNNRLSLDFHSSAKVDLQKITALVASNSEIYHLNPNMGLSMWIKEELSPLEVMGKVEELMKQICCREV